MNNYENLSTIIEEIDCLRSIYEEEIIFSNEKQFLRAKVSAQVFLYRNLSLVSAAVSEIKAEKFFKKAFLSL